jgi:hypothetical protein
MSGLPVSVDSESVLNIFLVWCLVTGFFLCDKIVLRMSASREFIDIRRFQSYFVKCPYSRIHV